MGDCTTETVAAEIPGMIVRAGGRDAWHGGLQQINNDGILLWGLAVAVPITVAVRADTTRQNSDVCHLAFLPS